MSPAYKPFVLSLSVVPMTWVFAAFMDLSICGVGLFFKVILKNASTGGSDGNKLHHGTVMFLSLWMHILRDQP